MPRFLLLPFALALAACSAPTSNGSTSDQGQVDGNDAAQHGDAATGDASNNGNNGVNNGGGGDCAAIGERFTEAVRAIPRDCVTDADCELLPRAQVCDCDLAVTAGFDTSDYQAVRAEADTAQCANPFGCPSGMCPYRKLSDPGEVYPHCNEGQCEAIQIMSCIDYESKLHGGMFGASSCMDNTECTLRNDLNACNCNEAVTTNFPFLTVQAIYEVIGINNERCNVTCMGCEAPGGAVCAIDGEGLRTCQTN